MRDLTKYRLEKAQEQYEHATEFCAAVKNFLEAS